MSDLPTALVSHVSAFNMVKCRVAAARRWVHFQSCFWLLEEQWLRKRSLLSRASLMMVCQASSNPLDSSRAFVTILNPEKLSFRKILGTLILVVAQKGKLEFLGCNFCPRIFLSLSCWKKKSYWSKTVVFSVYELKMIHCMARANLNKRKKSLDFYYHSIKVHIQEAQNLHQLKSPSLHKIFKNCLLWSKSCFTMLTFRGTFSK